MGMRLLRETMIVRAELDLASYDRFFPNQDFVPKEIFSAAGTELVVADQRPSHQKLALEFRGRLRADQEKALNAVLSHDMGVLVAPPGAGKTVMGCFAVARRNVPTLILAHRKPILDQWRAHLMDLLGLKSRDVGQVGGGRNRQSGIVDLSMIQSLDRMDDLEEFFAAYGFVVVDECHHIPAVTFERCVRRAPARHVLGLTATPYRRDGLEGIIEMQCGQIRHRIQVERSGLQIRLMTRDTRFSFPGVDTLPVPIQEIFEALSKDERRSRRIIEDVLQAISRGRRCLILSQRKEHCQVLADGLAKHGKDPFLLTGDLGKKERTAIVENVRSLPPDKDLVIVATGQFLGEGFDCPQIDTLFLAFPISFKGKVVQYVGRALRTHQNKGDVLIYDYVDSGVPVLRKMFDRRQKTYRTLGVDMKENKPAPDQIEPSLQLSR